MMGQGITPQYDPPSKAKAFFKHIDSEFLLYALPALETCLLKYSHVWIPPQCGKSEFLGVETGHAHSFVAARMTLMYINN